MEGRASRPSSRAETPALHLHPETWQAASLRLFRAMQLPRMYAILDAACFPDAAAMFAAAEELAAAGCSLLQYRNKSGNARRMLDEAVELRTRLGANVKL